MIWLIRNILLALSGETNPAQIAFGAVFGLFLGLCPISGIWFAAIFIILICRINFGMVFVFLFFGKMLLLSLGSINDELGFYILNLDSLKAFFTSLYNIPVIGISGFNKPAVMGALTMTVISSIAIIPLLIYITNIFREKIQPRLEKLWIIKVLKGSKLYQFYVRIIG